LETSVAKLYHSECGYVVFEAMTTEFQTVMWNAFHFTRQISIVFRCQTAIIYSHFIYHNGCISLWFSSILVITRVIKTLFSAPNWTNLEESIYSLYLENEKWSTWIQITNNAWFLGRKLVIVFKYLLLINLDPSIILICRL
jgi:hypothetical protein